ncbi:hypothetical protein JVU11DRAFT_9350 [Chiua virens]|nr:hypothetical protein JVU11DRAFT_9350 [Chiua virens]
MRKHAFFIWIQLWPGYLVSLLKNNSVSRSPPPFRNHFTDGFISDGVEAAMTVTGVPDSSHHSLVEMCGIYALPDFIIRLQECVVRCAGGNHSQQILQTFCKVKVWYKFRIQQHSTSSPSTILPSQAVQGEPPSAQFPRGQCDAVLLNMDGQRKHNPGYPIVQVKAIFQLANPPRFKVKLPGFLDLPLLYVQPFKVAATPDNEPDTRMWRFSRVFSDFHPGLARARAGLVIPLTEVTQAVDLVPIFGASIDRTVTTATSQEVYDKFYLNHYMDKESFDSLYESVDTDDLGDKL